MVQIIHWPCGQSPPPRLEEHVGSLTPGKETVGDRLLLLHWLDAALYVGLCLWEGPSHSTLMGSSWGHLGPSWGHLGAILGPSWGHLGAILRPIRSHLRISGTIVGPSRAHFAAISTAKRILVKKGFSPRRGASFHHARTAILARLEPCRGPLGAILGPSSAILWPS